MDGDRLALSVESVDGRVIRWGGDEPDAEMIPGDLEFSTSLPGGYKDLSCSLLRRLGGEERLFDRVRAYGPGNRTAWDGRLVQFPREDLQVNPGAVGWSSHLRDDPSFREIYVDRDLSHWGEPSVQRKLNLIGTARDAYAGTVTPDGATGQASLAAELQAPWAAGGFPIAEPTYRSAGIPLGQVYYAWKQGSAGIGTGGSAWTWAVLLASDDTIGSIDNSGDLEAAGPGTGTLVASTTGRFVAVTQFYYNGASSASDTNVYRLLWTCLAVYGTYNANGIGAPVGAGTATSAPGYYGHSLIQNIVSRTAPLLTATIGTGGVEPNTSFIVPQAAFLDPTTGEDAVMLINGYFLNEWGVYDDKKFFWRPPDPTRLVWQARADQGTHVSFEGETAEAQYNGVLVRFTDPNGQQRIAGPPANYWQGGTARCDVTNSVLVDTTSTNAVNRAGIPRKWGVLDIGPVTTDAGAVQLGYVWLQEHLLPQRRGTITVAGTVTHPTEGPVPPWRIRAGDSISTPDLADTDPKRIIETRYSRRDDSLVATVGNPDYKLDAILERIGVQLVGVTG